MSPTPERRYNQTSAFQRHFSLVFMLLGVLVLASLGAMYVHALPERGGRQPIEAVLFVGATGLLALALVIMGLYVTQRAAGPRTVLRRVLRDIRKGDWSNVGRVRAGDDLEDLHDAIAALADDVRRRSVDWLRDLDDARRQPSAGAFDESEAALRALSEKISEYADHTEGRTEVPGSARPRKISVG